MALQQHEEQYHSRDALTPALKSAGVTGLAGLFASSVQATLTKRNIGILGTFTHYGSTTITFGAMGGTYEFFRIAAANIREKNDSYNEAIGGFFSGSILGFRARTIPAVLGFGTGLAVIMAAYDYTGGSLAGPARDPNVDEYERKEALRANKRRPIQETLEQLGEGRGIYGPGYEERRRERIKQRYGIDVEKQ
ncbi:MAG: hypothetical protein M1831_005258 [Alyxoria varia]|nr:MAG: hypothetical protein M1831_005258 [Alyxoria varia]